MKKSALLALMAIFACSLVQPALACGADAECKKSGKECDKAKASAGDAKECPHHAQKEAAANTESKTVAKTTDSGSK